MISRNPAAMLNAGGALLFGALALANLHLPFPDALSQKGQTAKVSTLAPLSGETGSAQVQPRGEITSAELDSLPATPGAKTILQKRAPGLPRSTYPALAAADSTSELPVAAHGSGPKVDSPAVNAPAQTAPAHNFGMVSANPFADPGLPPPPPLPAAIPLPKSMGLSGAATPAKKPEPQKALNYKPGVAETPVPSPTTSVDKGVSEPIEKPRITQPPTPSYTLSAATGERAWVREGNDQTLTVQVGDALTGYGKITAITPDKVTFDTGRSLVLPSKSAPE